MIHWLNMITDSLIEYDYKFTYSPIEYDYWFTDSLIEYDYWFNDSLIEYDYRFIDWIWLIIDSRIHCVAYMSSADFTASRKALGRNKVQLRLASLEPNFTHLVAATEGKPEAVYVMEKIMDVRGEYTETCCLLTCWPADQPADLLMCSARKLPSQNCWPADVCYPSVSICKTCWPDAPTKFVFQVLLYMSRSAG